MSVSATSAAGASGGRGAPLHQLNKITLPMLDDGSPGHSVYTVPDFASADEIAALISAGDALLGSYGAKVGKKKGATTHWVVFVSHQPACTTFKYIQPSFKRPSSSVYAESTIHFRKAAAICCVEFS